MRSISSESAAAGRRQDPARSRQPLRPEDSRYLQAGRRPSVVGAFFGASRSVAARQGSCPSWPGIAAPTPAAGPMLSTAWRIIRLLVGRFGFVVGLESGVPAVAEVGVGPVGDHAAEWDGDEVADADGGVDPGGVGADGEVPVGVHGDDGIGADGVGCIVGFPAQPAAAGLD